MQRGEIEDREFPKLAFFLPAFVSPVGVPKRAMCIPRAVGMLFLFLSSISNKHFTVSGVNTNRSVLLKPCACAWILP